MSAREIECAEEWLAAALDDEPDQETVEYWRDEGLKAKTIRLFAEPVRPSEGGRSHDRMES